MTVDSGKSKGYAGIGTAGTGSDSVPIPAPGIGTRIAAVSEVIGTREAAASAMGVSPAALQRYIRETNMPPFEAAARLCLAAGVRMEWLATGVAPKRVSEPAKPSYDAGSQPVRLDADRLASLIETVDSALRLTGRPLSAKGRAGVIAALYEAEAWRGAEAVTTALTVILNAIKEEHPDESRSS